MTAMPSMRHLWKSYKRDVLQEGLGITRRNEVQILAQNAFYLGAQSVLQCLAFLLEHGHEDEVHEFIERQGRQLKAMRGEAGPRHGTSRRCAVSRI